MVSVLNVTHQGASPDLGRSLMSTIASWVTVCTGSSAEVHQGVCWNAEASESRATDAPADTDAHHGRQLSADSRWTSHVVGGTARSGGSQRLLPGCAGRHRRTQVSSQRFLPSRRYASAGLAVVPCLSVCLSVSVTSRWDERYGRINLVFGTEAYFDQFYTVVRKFWYLQK